MAARRHTPCEVADGHPYLEEGVHSPAEAVLHAGADGRSLEVDHHVHSQAVGHSLTPADHNLAEEDVHTQVAEACHAADAHSPVLVVAHSQAWEELLAGGCTHAEEEVRNLLDEAAAHHSHFVEEVQRALLQAARRPMAEGVDARTHRPLEKARGAEVLRRSSLHRQQEVRKQKLPEEAQTAHALAAVVQLPVEEEDAHALLAAKVQLVEGLAADKPVPAPAALAARWLAGCSSLLLLFLLWICCGDSVASCATDFDSGSSCCCNCGCNRATCCAGCWVAGELPLQRKHLLGAARWHEAPAKSGEVQRRARRQGRGRAQGCASSSWLASL